jgi:Trp operon repressor
MADPLSIAAGIAGLVTLAEEVFQLVCRFGRLVRDAQNDIKRLSIEIRGLSVLLYELVLLAKSFEDDGLNTFFRLHHVNSCRQTVQDVKSRLDKALSGTRDQGWQATVTRLKWPYTSKEIKRLLEEISTYKETMGLALTADTMKAMLKALSKQEDLSNEISVVQQTLNDIQTRIVVDKHRQDVLDFFVRENP